MFSKTHELMIESIFALHSWCKGSLPIENSFIAYDLHGADIDALNTLRLFFEILHRHNLIYQLVSDAKALK